MIISVTSDQKSFKNVYFESGFNVVLADRTKDSTKKDSLKLGVVTYPSLAYGWKELPKTKTVLFKNATVFILSEKVNIKLLRTSLEPAKEPSLTLKKGFKSFTFPIGCSISRV